MDKLSFYKSIFDKEQNRRNELNNAINQPITLVTVLVGLLYFIYNKVDLKDFSFINSIIIIILIYSICSFLICVYYLALSFNNLLKGFEYKDFPKTDELFNYNKQLEDYNLKVNENEKINFDDYLVEKYVEYSASFVAINDKRSLYLYMGKKSLIVILALEIVTIILLLIKLNIK